jgi:sulfatase maturation enzyme AslB (radical SAM superfamily)
MCKNTQVFDADRIAGLDKMFMCGNYGDPAAGKYTLNIYREFRKLNKKIVLGMNSNGALQNTLWWHELGTIFNQSQDYVVFSIDGMEDTNSVYRKNVSWTKLMHNVEAFIAAGGSAHWDMLVYRHNQHQVDACEQLARDIGFKWFRAKVSKRGFTARLEQPIGWQIPRVQTTEISCHALKEQSLYIDAQGRASPCCWLGATQKDFVADFDTVQDSWHSTAPNTVCVATCGTSATGTVFTNQWQREVELC